MPIDPNVVRAVLETSLDQFFERESGALRDGVSERNNCARLAMYMQAAANEAGLDEYIADPEFNRKQGGLVKTILDEAWHEVAVTCDLVLHSRGAVIANDNLIAVEMKKRARPPRELDSDRIRLRALTKPSYDDIWSVDGGTHPEHVCGYALGVLIIIDKQNRRCSLEYYEQGAQVGEEIRTF